MNVRLSSLLSRVGSAFVVVVVLCLIAVLSGQNASVPLTLMSRDGRRSVPLATVGGQDMIALDDLAAAFQLAVREESGAVTVSYKGRTIVLTPDQALASVSGRLVSLSAPLSRSGGRWVVPVEFISRALALIYDVKLDLRRPSHLLVVGDLRVPHVSVRYEPLATAARLTIDATPRATSALTEDAGRLLIKFDADAIDATLPAFQPQGFLAAVRVVDGVTIGAELGPRFSSFRASSEAIGDTTRLVIDLLGVEPNTSAAPAAPAPVPPSPAELPAFRGSAPAVQTIAIDPGHGGDDEGAKGVGGTAEKAVTLAVAERLKATIEARLGIRVLLTRDEDRAVPIDERAAIANNSKADLFISLHANASLRGGPSGASIYVASFNESEDTRAALKPERVPTFGGGLRDIGLVEWRLAQVRFLGQSTHLAQILQAEFQGRVPLDAHQLFAAGPFRVLESANMPAVLIEMGYLTNPDQEKQLAGAEFQNTFTQAVMDGVVKFRDALGQGGER